MYFNILKKDLKRKKTMNVILLIFIAMASMFVSSSVNNMLAILNATDNYFERAQVKDYIAVTIYEEKNEEKIRDFFDTNSYVDDWDSAEILMVSAPEVKKENGKKLKLKTGPMVMKLGASDEKFFDSKDREITEIEDNDIYIPLRIMEENNLKTGDKIRLCGNDKEAEFVIAGNCKDALLGADMMGTIRFLVSEKGYEKIQAFTERKGTVYAADSENLEKLEEKFNEENVQVLFNGTRDFIKMTYVMDMVIAGLLLVVSVALIMISLVILRFTIVFTLNEEFREIGVMKAVGIPQRKIRGIYMVKYLLISVVGAAVGFFAGIPFGNVMMKEVSRNIVLDSTESTWLLNLACALMVVLIVMLFCYRSTGRVKKFSPIDAIRDGSIGERFTRKGLFKLGKWHGGPVTFMAFNDICTGLRSFAVLLLIFTIGMLLIIIPVNTINTLHGDDLVNWFGMKESNLCILNDDVDNKLVTEKGRQGVSDSFAEMEETMTEHGIPAKVSQEVMFRLRISLDGKFHNTFCLQGNGSNADEYVYEEGTAPKYENEIAITKITADHIDAEIGDTITIAVGEEEKEYLITAFYQSMNSGGEGLRFSEKADIDFQYNTGTFARQIVYQDEPSPEEEEARREEIEKLFPEYKVYTCGEYITEMMGNITGPLNAVKKMIVVVVMGINMLVAVLVSKTFLTKERGEIGMLKAIGFSNGSLIRWQVLRMGMILVMSVFIGALLSGPAAQISSGKVFEMMGATHIEFVVKPLEVFVIYPLMVLAATLVGTLIAVLQIRRISAQETNNIE